MSAILGSKRVEVWKKSKGFCWYCGRELASVFDVDHMIPISRGGTDEIGNLFPSCKSCNTRKHDRSLEGFRLFMAMGGINFSVDQRALLQKIRIENSNALNFLESFEAEQIDFFKFWFERKGL